MILIIDNYDSFVFNLARYFVELDEQVKVVRNDEILPAQIKAKAIVISIWVLPAISLKSTVTLNKGGLSSFPP